MQFDGAVINEQGVTFAIANVQSSVLSSPTQRDKTLLSFSAVFDGLPTILMAQDSSGRPTYYGRPDLVRFMAGVPLQAVRWQRYTV
jgi:hypothetical protein